MDVTQYTDHVCRYTSLPIAYSDSYYSAWNARGEDVDKLSACAYTFIVSHQEQLGFLGDRRLVV